MDIIAELIKAFSSEQEGFVFMWVLSFLAFSALLLIAERWFDLWQRTNVDADIFCEKIKKLISEKKNDEALKICMTAGKRALPRIIGAGINKIDEPTEVILSAMEEESLHLIPILEKRVNYILVFGNVSTLLGLMGTIYGLILSFAAVAQPDVDPIAKTSMLASGISTAMNTTLLGLTISIPCVLIFSLLRSKIDQSIHAIDRYSRTILKVILPNKAVKKEYRVTGKRIIEEVDTEPNIAPMMNLMVILIPLLLSSAEFIKIGAIELKLPEASAGGGDASGQDNPEAKLNLGIVIKKDGFNLFHYFKQQPSDSLAEESKEKDKIEIPKKNGEYNYHVLNSTLAEVKKQALFEIIRTVNPSVPKGANLTKLYNHYLKNDYTSVKAFSDHEELKIVAEEDIRYETVVAVMDAARGTKTPHGKVTLFPNVSLAGGIIQ